MNYIINIMKQKMKLNNYNNDLIMTFPFRKFISKYLFKFSS